MSDANYMGKNTSYNSSVDVYTDGDYGYYDLPTNTMHFSGTGSDGTIYNVKHYGLIDYYMAKFDQFARGRVANKYHVYFYGPYVEQAILIMNRNAKADKYQYTDQKKTFIDGETSTYEKFKSWASMFFDEKTSTVSMYWSAASVDIGEAKAEIEDVYMDSLKSMAIPLIKGVQTGKSNTMNITVVDDPYMMWYQFFNALFNTQFHPLALKPTSTFDKINVRINEYMEMSTASGNYTDAHIGQMFEFNRCVLNSAPKTSLKFDGAGQVTYTITLSYPNAFQGSFKERSRYMTHEYSCTDADACINGEYNKAKFECGTFNNLAEHPNRFAAYRLNAYKSEEVPANLNKIHAHAETLVGWNGEQYYAAK